MKKTLVTFLVSFIALSIGKVAIADDDFYGVIEKRPECKLGEWIIGGRSVEVTELTELDEDNGPLKIGACAEVDIDEGKVEEIESAPAKKCSK